MATYDGNTVFLVDFHDWRSSKLINKILKFAFCIWIYIFHSCNLIIVILFDLFNYAYHVYLDSFGFFVDEISMICSLTNNTDGGGGGGGAEHKIVPLNCPWFLVSSLSERPSPRSKIIFPIVNSFLSLWELDTEDFILCIFRLEIFTI